VQLGVALGPGPRVKQPRQRRPELKQARDEVLKSGGPLNRLEAFRLLRTRTPLLDL
jgi:hypothetical protein